MYFNVFSMSKKAFRGLPYSKWKGKREIYKYMLESYTIVSEYFTFD